MRPGCASSSTRWAAATRSATAAPKARSRPLLLVRNAVVGDGIHPIPDSLPFEKAALAEPLSVSLHAVNRAGVQPGSKVAVFGAGSIGLGIVLFLAAARHRGHRRRRRIRSAARSRPCARRERDDQPGARRRRGSGSVRLHGRGELFGWPVVGTDTFFEVSGAARGDPFDHRHGALSRLARRRGRAPRAGAGQLPDGARQGDDHHDLDGVPERVPGGAGDARERRRRRAR